MKKILALTAVAFAVAVSALAVFAQTSTASPLSDRVETWLKNNYYPVSGEPWPVKTANCTRYGDNDWLMFSCDLVVRDPYTNPDLPPVYYNLDDRLVMVIANDPLDIHFCEFQPCRG